MSMLYMGGFAPPNLPPTEVLSPHPSHWPVVPLSSQEEAAPCTVVNTIHGKVIAHMFHNGRSRLGNPNLGTSLALYRGQKLSLENSEKSLKRGSRGLSAELSDTRGREAPGTPFSDFFRSFLGRGLFEPCRKPTMSQS